MAPAKLVAPTINKEYAEAKTGSILNRYTRIGIESIEPPPPSKPNKKPIKTETI